MKRLSLLLLGLILLTLPALAYESPSEVTEGREYIRAERESRDADETAALMSGGSSTVGVTLRLPGGVTAPADTEAYVGLYAPAEVNASGRVIRTPQSVTRKRVTFTRGASTATASFENVAAGNYIFEVETDETNGCGVINNYNLYYHGDGSMASSQYTAVPFSLSEGASVNQTLTLPAAEASISGVLNFSAPLTRDTEFEIYCYGQGRTGGSYYLYFTAPQGARSAPFSVGVRAGSYSMEFSNTRFSEYYYLDYDGTLTTEYSREYYCTVTAGRDASGISVDADPLLSGTSEGTAETVQVNVTVTLPQALTQEKRFRLVAVYPRNDSVSYKSSSMTVQAGQTFFSRAMNLNIGTEYALGYRDVTDCNSTYSVNTARDVRYLAQDGGITTLYENARKFRFTADTSVAIQEPPCGHVTGRVSRNGFNAGMRADAYAYALFPDGERYCARVLLGTADSAAFSIDVPLTKRGQTFQLSAVMARPSTNYPVEGSASESVSLTFNGNLDAGNVAVSGDYVTASGTVSLPSGVSAPVGGQAVRLTVYGDNIYYVIPAGSNSVPFSFQSYRRGNSSESLYAYLESPLSGVFDETRHSHYFNNDADEAEKRAWYQNRSLVFPAAVVISGTASLPSGVRDVGTTLYFQTSLRNSDSDVYASASSYASILRGNGSTAYAFQVPFGQLSQLQIRVMSSTDGRVNDSSLYVDSGWNVVQQRPDAPNATGDRSGVNFTLDVFASGVTPRIVSLQSSDGGENVLEGIRTNRALYVTCEGPGGTEAMLVAALYDAQGRFLSSAVQSYVELRRSGEQSYLRFEGQPSADAVRVRVFLLRRSGLVPLDMSEAT
ncbi:MAG: hypothetical protein IJT31_10005 [Oscillibacter sp.]|nr:hypothetical protein [Oscillibacter sp.]